VSCPYCGRHMGAMTLREHVAINTCGKCPPGSCVAFSEAEAQTVTEDEYRKTAERVAKHHGWLVSHVERSRGRDGYWHTPTAPGFPDSWFVHPQGRLLVVEFKSQKGKTAPKLRLLQHEWLLAVSAVEGATAMRSRPSGWPHLQACLTLLT